MTCFINGCTFYAAPGHSSIHRIWSKGKPREGWLDAIKEFNAQHIDPSELPKDAAICNKHFDKKCILNYGYRKFLTHDAVPTIFPKNTIVFVSMSTSSQTDTNFFDERIYDPWPFSGLISLEEK